MIESHHDIGSPAQLQAYRCLRRQLAAAAIDVRTECHPVFADARVACQAEYLEAAAVSQDGPVPSHEPMQSASRDQSFQTRPQHEVVGVGEDDLCPGGAHLLRQKRLDGGLGAYWHERRGLDHPTTRCHPPAAGASSAVDREHLESKWATCPAVGHSGCTGGATQSGRAPDKIT